MKLRLSQHLKTAILAAMAAVSSYTYADTILISDGINKDDVTKSERFYDTGKGYYFSWYQYSNYWHDLKDLRDSKGSFAFLGDVYERMPANTTTTNHDSLTDDAQTCWAQVSMNMVEYWHSYYGIFCNDSRELTYGLCYDKKYLDETGGTLSLKQNLVFLDTFSNDGDSLWSYLDWFMLGDDNPWFAEITTKNQGGYWTDYFTTSYSTRNWYAITSNNLNDIDDLTTALLTTLGYVKNTDGTYTQRIKGQIAYIGMDSTDGGGHAITCHGVELDETGKIKALYVTNSDDLAYKLFKLYLKADSTRLLLYTNEKCTELWEYSNANWYIDSVGGIRTPELLQDMLAEYEDADNALVWTGNTTANGLWDLKSAPTTLELPDETSGWEIYAVDGYYAAYFDKDRIICFDDYADSGAVNVKNSGTAFRMELNNKTLDYSFTGTGSNTLTVDTLVAANGGKTSFQQLQLTTTEALLNNHTISMGNGAKWMGQAQVAIKGTVELAGGTLALTKLTLNGGTLSITGNGNTLASGAISSSNGATLLFTPTGTTTTPMLTIGSGVSFSGSALDIAMGGESMVFDTTYALISFENAQTDWQKLFTTEQGEFTYTNHILYLIYNPVPKLTWSGTTGTWSSERWGSTTTGTNDLRAEFTGSGTRTVTISGTVRPYSITVDNSGAVTFNGSGNISGNGVLKKSGNGSLTINTANSYSGGTQISGGTLTVGHASALGSGDIALSEVTLNLSSKSVSNTLNVSGNATINGGSAYNGVLVLADGHLSGEALRLGKNATVQSGEISNVLTETGKITKSGSGTVTLSGANTYSGGTAITGGTLVAGHASALGSGAVSLTGGTLNMNGKALSNTIKAGSGNNCILNGGNYTGALTLSGGTLTVESGDMDCSNLTLSGGIFMLDNSTYKQGSPMVDVSGTLSITAATKIGFTNVYGVGTHILFDFGTLTGNLSNLTLMPQSGKYLEYEIYKQGSQVLLNIKTSGALLTWQEASGTWSVGGGGWQQGKVFEQGDQAVFTQAAKVTLQGNLAPSVIKVDSSQAVVFSGTGAITGTADLTKKGQGQLQLNAANPHWTGNIYLQGGTITATGNTSFGKGDIHATSNATLNLGGKVIDNDIYISNGATVGILGGSKFTGSVDVTGNLAVKSTINIAEGESITLHSGKHSATVTGKGTMRIVDGSVTLQTGKYTMSRLDIASKLTIMKQGLALAKTDSFITITEGGSLVSSGNISGCHLSVWDGSINIRNSNPVNITLNGDFTAENSSSIRIYGALKGDSFTLNQSTFKLSGEKPQAITIKKGMSINGGTGFSTNGNVTAAYLEVND
ncbi:MAG: IdeS/Mac family cysteine endopeptidase, partial [Akkermansia sp.]|nr:IdeS/Mac family cysteine endopeptidase [Akkermansia sp.]